MELIACRCEAGYGLPHDHRIGTAVREGVYQAIYDRSDVGHLWVNWKGFARELMEADDPCPTTIPSQILERPAPTETPAGAPTVATASAGTSPGKDRPPDVRSMD